MEIIPDLLKHGCKMAPKNIAIEYNDKHLTYSDLSNEVNLVKDYLLNKGVKPGDRVALCLSNSHLFVSLFFALSDIGAIAVPLNISYKQEEINKYLNTAYIKCFIFPDTISLKKKYSEINDKISIKVRPGEEVLHQLSSGSTAMPKRVGRTHFNILNEAQSISYALRLSSKDKILCLASLFHAYGFGFGMMASIYSGATLVITDGFKPSAILNLLERENISVLFAVPHMFSILSKAARNKKIKFSSLRWCFSSGISLPAEMAGVFYDQFGIFPRQIYGTTETGCLTINSSRNIEDNSNSVGQPIGGVKIDITSSGEIRAKSSSAGKYYYDGDGQRSPLLQDGYFYTGDIGKIDAYGNLYITGRGTCFINVAGAKVAPQEIEEVLRTCPLVEDVAVLGVPDRLRGEAIKAVIVPQNGRQISRKEIVKYCRIKLADFKMPRIIEFREEIPKSSLGKVLRGYL